MSAMAAETKLTYDIVVRKNATGEERVYQCGLDWLDHTEFFLTEGNFGCDCNRGICFERANNPKWDGDRPCGHDTYTIPRVILSDGRKVPIDDTDD